MHREGFDYTNTQTIHDEIKALVDEATSETESDTWYYPGTFECPQQLRRLGRWATDNGDALVRRAKPLQEAASQEPTHITVHPDTAQTYNLRQGKSATVMQNGGLVSLPVNIDDRVSPNTVVVYSGLAQTENLGEAFGVVEIK